jgi:tetratricopeptide (TPR) repeat protein
MGQVFHAIESSTRSEVALKVLRGDTGDPDATTRFDREVDALARLRHPCIVAYVTHGLTDDGAPFVAMQWVAGEELRVRLKRGVLDVEDTLVVVSRIADALAHAHAQGITHRDVKPSNILLQGGDIARATLIDFGLARSENDELTRTGAIVGTPTHMAPEQIRNEVSPAVDVFALGCVIYQCLSGVTPFAAKGATAVLARILFDEPTSLASLAVVPVSLAELVESMLRKAPGDRPSMAEVAATLARLVASRSEPPETQRHREKLSAVEQRVASVIVAGESPQGDEHEKLRHATGVLAKIDLEPLRGVAARFGGEMHALPNGTLVVMFMTSAAATDLAARAAECALELERLLQGVPVGLATGRAETKSSVPVGEAIDRAVALEPSYEGGVRIDRVTAALLDSRFVQEARPEGALLRGKRAMGAVRTLLGRPTPCVGRDVELAMLEGIVAQSSNESVARAVIVTAPAGTGKSRIRHEFLARIAARGTDARTWIARGDSMSGGGPFGMVAQMIRQTANVLEGEPVQEIHAKLRARVAVSVDERDRDRIVTFLGEIIQAHFSADDDIQLQAARRDPMLMGDQMQRAFVDWVDAECAKTPLVIVLEDLHWGDLPSVSAIDAVLRVSAERALTVIGFARPEVSESFPGLWKERGVQPIPLSPLSKRAAERLVRDVLGYASTALVDRLVERAAGNAFYLEELIRTVSEGREDLPATVVAMVQSRLGALEDGERRILRAASVFGETFWEGSVRALLGDDAIDLGARLDDFAQRELLTRHDQSRLSGEVEYVFRHALVREGAYAMLTEDDRKLGHRLAAEWLERVGETAAIVIADHFAKGGDAPRAVSAYLRASEQALESNDLAGAIERAERGVELGAVGETLGALRCVQAQAHQWRGETVEMEQAALVAVQLLPHTGARRPEAMTMLAVAKQRLGHTEELTTVARRLFEMLESAEGDRDALARAGGRVASILFFAGKQELAATMLDAAEQTARGGGAEVEARIHQARSPRERQAGRPAHALAHAEAAEAAFTLAGDQRNACLMAGVRGFALSELGAYEDAERALRDVLAAAERLGLSTVAANARSNLGVVLLRLGRASEAESVERAAIASVESNDQRHEGAARVYLAMILRDGGSFDEAEREARLGLELLASAPALRPIASATLATILLATGRAQEALEVVRDAMRWIDAGGNLEEGDALVRLTFARALFATGDRASARDLIARAHERLRSRAETIEEARFRKTFMENVPDHAMTIDLAARWA